MICCEYSANIFFQTEVVRKQNKENKNDEKEFKNNIKKQEEQINVSNVILLMIFCIFL